MGIVAFGVSSERELSVDFTAPIMNGGLWNSVMESALYYENTILRQNFRLGYRLLFSVRVCLEYWLGLIEIYCCRNLVRKPFVIEAIE